MTVVLISSPSPLYFRRYFRSPILDFRVVLGRWDLYQSKAHPQFPNTSQYKVLLYLLPLGRNSNAKLGTPIRPPLGERVRVDLLDRKLYHSKCRPHFAMRHLYKLKAYLALFGHNTQRARQTTDRAIGIGRIIVTE